MSTSANSCIDTNTTVEDPASASVAPVLPPVGQQEMFAGSQSNNQIEGYRRLIGDG
jgi:hypothetical protein